MSEKDRKTKLPFFGIPSLWPWLKNYKMLALRMIILGLLVSMCDVIFPMFNRYAINHFLGNKTFDTIILFILSFLAVLICQGIMNYINVMDCSKMELYMNRDLRNSAFSHLQEVSLSYYNQNNVGYIHARVMSDSGKIGEMMAWRCMDVIWFGSYILFALTVMLITNWKLALFIIALVPIAVIFIFIFQKKLLVLNHKVREMNARITAGINEGITGVKSIKTLSIEGKMTDEFADDTTQMYHRSVRTTHYSALFSSSVTLMSSVALAIVLWKGGELNQAKLMEIGTLSIFMSYALGLLDPIQNMVNAISKMISIQVNIERYCNLMNTEGEVFDTKEVIEKYGDTFNEKRDNWEPLIGDVEFKDVTFHYPDGDELVLEHFDLKVPKGANVAIVGETGAGKSTLVNLVCRFFEPTSGQVLIDSKDIKERSLQWLHSNIGYVLQSPHLFSGNIRDNLKYGKEDATDEEIYNALKLVSADSIIDKLTDGLDTEVGEGGDFLSTGEKQLLSIVRALLADPKILILDEATASIDTVTEKAIQEAISTVIKGRTSFVIAHRLSTIVNADIILVVSDGKIIERGSHKELIEAKGAYFDLYTKQYEELIIDQSFN
ncbi:MAG: ABC transporter ATP-binding protein [Lachnospiraceae bacterium]|nr:ABC transporter ATP-binding protein [Lachnospiraceae bacterium]MBQ2407284.1 ABC transporter ATP-binding protein [Lachnospiraceae bacterium]